MFTCSPLGLHTHILLRWRHLVNSAMKKRTLCLVAILWSRQAVLVSQAKTVLLFTHLVQKVLLRQKMGRGLWLKYFLDFDIVARVCRKQLQHVPKTGISGRSNVQTVLVIRDLDAIFGHKFTYDKRLIQIYAFHTAMPVILDGNNNMQFLHVSKLCSCNITGNAHI